MTNSDEHTEQLTQEHSEYEQPEGEQMDPAETPGFRLRAEREARGLSENEVANELHITRHYVQAIEENQFGKLPGDIFARGYIKNYALLLELNAEELLAAYRRFTAAKDETEKEAARRVRDRRTLDRNMPWFIFSGVALVVVAIGLWYFNLAGDSAPAGSGSDTLGQRSSSARAEPAAEARSRQPASRQPEPSQSEQRREVERTGERSLIAAEETESPAEAAAGNTFDGQTQEENQEEENQDEAGDPSEETGSRASQAEGETDDYRLTEVAAEGSDVLEIRFSDESWVEVDDRNDNELYQDLRTGGDLLRITGRAPFNVLLGHAPAAELSLNGGDIDVSSSIRIDQSARVTVGL